MGIVAKVIVLPVVRLVKEFVKVSVRVFVMELVKVVVTISALVVV